MTRRPTGHDALFEVASRVGSIGRSGYADAKWPLVRKEIETVSTAEDLRSLVLVLYGLLTPQKGDESYDFAFEAAVRASLQKLATIPTNDASAALESLRPLIGHDASLGLQEAIDEQRKITNGDLH
jgi:hypothetical protein